MKIKDLVLFCDLVKLQNKSAVAERHNLSIQNVSYGIASLEKYYNTKLFLSGGNKYSLSETGKLIYEFAIEQLRLFNNLTYEQSNTNMEKEVIIELMKSAEEVFLPELLIDNNNNKLLNKLINVNRILDMDIIEQQNKIVNGEIDITIFWNFNKKITIKNPNIILQKIFVCSPCIWTSYESEIASLSNVHKQDLTKLLFVNTSGGDAKLTQAYTSFLKPEQIIFATDQKTLIANMVEKNVAQFIDFCLPNGKSVNENVFKNYNIKAIPLIGHYNLECLVMYRNEGLLEAFVRNIILKL